MHVHTPESSLGEWSTIIGIVTAIVGNVLISIALNIQRYAHIRLNKQSYASKKGTTYGTIRQEAIAEERAQLNANAPAVFDRNNGRTTPILRPLGHRTLSLSAIKHSETQCSEDERKNYLKSPYWWAGILLMTIGEAGNFIAYGFAPASIVSPLGVVALISNCVIAPFMLKERFRRRDLAGVLVAVAGAVSVVLSAETSETKMGPKDIWQAITRWEFELYLGITAVMMIILVFASRRYGQKSILIDLGLVGLFGGYTALSTKGVASLLSYTLWRTLTFPITYLLAAILVATALLQIRYLNKALQRFDSTQVIPTQFVLFTISVIVGSAILYRDFETATVGRVAKFIGGCALTFAGVYTITSGRAQPPVSDDGIGCDEEAEIGLVDEGRPKDPAAPADDTSSSRSADCCSRSASPPVCGPWGTPRGGTESPELVRHGTLPDPFVPSGGTGSGEGLEDSPDPVPPEHRRQSFCFDEFFTPGEDSPDPIPPQHTVKVGTLTHSCNP